LFIHVDCNLQALCKTKLQKLHQKLQFLPFPCRAFRYAAALPRHNVFLSLSEPEQARQSWAQGCRSCSTGLLAPKGSGAQGWQPASEPVVAYTLALCLARPGMAKRPHDADLWLNICQGSAPSALFLGTKDCEIFSRWLLMRCYQGLRHCRLGSLLIRSN
jgi:hypothetical protein